MTNIKTSLQEIQADIARLTDRIKYYKDQSFQDPSSAEYILNYLDVWNDKLTDALERIQDAGEAISEAQEYFQ